MHLKYGICLSCAAVLVSCMFRPEPQRASYAFETLLNDSTEYYDELVGRPAAALQLPDLRRGCDSLCVRFWYFAAFSVTERVFCLQKKTGEPWSGQSVLYETSASGFKILAAENLSRAPALWHTLDSLGILSFRGMTPDQLGRYTDGETVIVEIATARRYVRSVSQCERAYPSHNPSPVVGQISAMLEALFRHRGD